MDDPAPVVPLAFQMIVTCQSSHTFFSHFIARAAHFASPHTTPHTRHSALSTLINRVTREACWVLLCACARGRARLPANFCRHHSSALSPPRVPLALPDYPGIIGLSTFHGALCMQHSGTARFCPPVGSSSNRVENGSTPAAQRQEGATAWVMSASSQMLATAKGMVPQRAAER